MYITKGLIFAETKEVPPEFQIDFNFIYVISTYHQIPSG